MSAYIKLNFTGAMSSSSVTNPKTNIKLVVNNDEKTDFTTSRIDNATYKIMHASLTPAIGATKTVKLYINNAANKKTGSNTSVKDYQGKTYGGDHGHTSFQFTIPDGSDSEAINITAVSIL